MDGELRELERHLESMKATYLLNKDKLRYNERVLKERLPETQATTVHQKRKLASQRSILAGLKASSRQHRLYQGLSDW